MDNTNTENQNVEAAGTQETPAQEAKPTSMADLLAARNKQLKDSEIPDQRSITKDITVNEGTKYEYTLTVQYPGFGVASMIEDDSSDNGDVKLSKILQNAVDNGVFVQPHINSIDFWNTHKGGPQVAAEVLSFLNDGIGGNLE